MRRSLMMVLLSVVSAGVGLLPVEPARAGKFNKVVEIGQAAPEWKDLPGVDGRRHALADLREARAVVVVFTCNHCPVAKAYEDRLIALAKQWKERRVEVVAISVSRVEADSLDAMRKRSQERGFPFASLQDLSQRTGQAYGALCTPHVFVLDARRRIAYMGAIDDSLHADRVKERYLTAALEAVLAGREPEITETKPVGCPIDYEEP